MPLESGQQSLIELFEESKAKHANLRYEEGRGRFAVAAREIKVGELIAKEKPYVSLLDRELV